MSNSVSSTPSSKHRRRQRVKAALPVSCGGSDAVTRDISATGVFIVQNTRMEIGAQIDFSLDLETPGGKLKLCFGGAVVRVEEMDGRYGIGVNITKQLMKSAA
ncbi:MAG: PilZ domain-containing protein [Sterolibacterium sp.]